MPIDISTDATTRSMIRNGRNSRKPISKARFNSEIMKAGISTRSETSSGVAGLASLRQVHEQREILLADILQHEGLERSGRALKGLLGSDLVIGERTQADLIGVLEKPAP